MTQPPNQQPGWWQPQGQGPQRQQWPQEQQWPQAQQWPQPPSGQPYWQQQGAPGYSGHQPGFGGGFGQPTTYGGLGVFGGEPPRRKRAKKPWILGGVAVVLLAGGGVAAWLLGAFQGEVLDQGSVQDGVLKVLRESYGEGDVRDARCPKDQPTKTGTTFECSVTVAGQPKKVSIRVLNDKPEFDVGAPK